MKLTHEQLTLRDMAVDDLSAVIDIENQVQIMPWSCQSFEESLSKEGYLCRVIEGLIDLIPDNHAPDKKTKEVMAFFIACSVADELHILNVVVAKQHQGQGLGHVLINDIIDIAKSIGEGSGATKEQRKQKIKRIFLEVRASNKVAQNLYRQWQFQTLSIRKGYYRTPNKEREDALVLVKELKL